MWFHRAGQQADRRGVAAAVASAVLVGSMPGAMQLQVSPLLGPLSVDQLACGQMTLVVISDEGKTSTHQVVLTGGVQRIKPREP